MASTSNRALLANYLLGQQSSAMGKNYISNPSAFMNTVGTSVTGSATIARNTTSPLTAISDFSISLPNNATDYVAFSTDTFDSSMSGKNCELRLDYTASSIGSNVVVQIVQGSNIVASSSALSTASTARTVSVNAPCGDLSTATTIRVANSTGNSGTSALKVANVTYGLATNLSQVSQAQFIGSLKWAPTVNCIWTTSSTSFVNFSNNSDCDNNARIVSGSVTDVSAGLRPAISVPVVAGTRYRVRFRAAITAKSNNSIYVYPQFRLYDGTTALDGAFLWGDDDDNFTQQSLSEMSFEFTALTTETKTLDLQVKNGVSPQSVSVDAEGQGMEISVYSFPGTSELAYRPDRVAWRVDANISGAVIGLGTGAVSSYSEITSGSLTLTQNAGSIATQIACASGTASSGTTCTAANESVGVVFNVPTAGDVLACASFAHNSQGSGGEVITTFQIMETTNTSSAIVQEGKTRLVSGGGPTTILKNPLRVCGTFTFASAGQKTLRLQYEQAGSINVSEILADQNPAIGSPDIHWEVYPITQAIPAPLLVGSVTSNSAGLERVERVRVTAACLTTNCALAGSTSGIASVDYISAGYYQLNFASGAFSGTPSCVGNCAVADGCMVMPDYANTSSTIWRFETKNKSGVSSNATFNFTCQGPR